jgi:signal peptidase I
MKGKFRIADFLIIELGKMKNLRKGDIIAFFKKSGDGKYNDPIVHRIIHLAKEHCFTKGDNNRRPDIFPVAESDLIGKVVAFERGGKTHRVKGGIAGLIGARMIYILRRAGYLLSCRLRKYLPVKKISDIVFIFWKPEIQKLEFSTAKGPLIKWVHRNRTIATWLPEKNLLKASFLSRFLLNQKNPN